METERNPNEPIKPTAPGQQGGGQQGDRDKEKEREREKQGGAANRVAGASKAAANKEAVSKADDKLCRELTKRREATPAVFLVRLPPPKFSVSSGAQENVAE